MTKKFCDMCGKSIPENTDCLVTNTVEKDSREIRVIITFETNHRPSDLCKGCTMELITKVLTPVKGS